LRFTVRRPASAQVSPCCRRPSGGDVACSVHVGVAWTSGAGLALENRLALTVPERDMPARRASLRRVRGRDLFDPTQSLVLQPRSEQSPAAASDGAVKAALRGDPPAGLLHSSARAAGHRSHIKGFYADRVEAPGNVRADLLDPVLATVRLTPFELRDRQPRASTPVRTALGAGKALLQHLDPSGLSVAQARGVQQLTGRQCRRHHNTTVDTHNALVTRTHDRIRDVAERDMPAASPITRDPIRLHPRGGRSRQPKAHPPDLRHTHPSEPAIQSLNVMRFHPDLPEPFMDTGLAPPRAAVRSREEVVHRLGEVPQRLLLNRLRPSRQPVVLGAGSRQLSTLLPIVRRMPPGLPMLVLLDGQVPHVPGMATVLRQHHCLLSSREQPVSHHACNLTFTTDKSPKGEPALPPPAKARGFHAASTQ
jgi:hypothetical protein